MMKKKIGFAIACMIIIGIIILGVRHKLGIIKISSIIDHHPKLNGEVLIRKAEDEDDYGPLLNDMVISGEIQLKVEAQLGEEEYAYVEYKVNGFHYAPAYLPSYGTSIDTEELPDGWNQILVIGYNDGGNVLGVKQGILKVDNNEVKQVRAARQGDLYKIDEKPSYKRDYIPVLMYHDFQEDISEEEESGTVHPDLFEKQLEALLENNYTPIHFQDLFLYTNGKGGLPKKPVIITADDGYLSNYEKAFPILKKYNSPATFFITTRYVGVDTSSPHFTWEQAKEMEESGLIDIQSHTHSHLLLNTLPDDEVGHQVDISFGIIEKNLGKRDVKVLAYPQFYHNRHTKKKLEAEGIDLQVTNLAKRYRPTTKATNIQRIHVANYMSPEELIKEIERLTR